MNLEKTGLVLEGGGMRGVYTSGVLQYFMENGLYFPYVIGVSMGACNAANYISKQLGRNKIVNIKYVDDERYLSYKSLIFRGELFRMNFIFNVLPNNLEPFDYKTFYANKAKCISVVTDCITGEPVYYEKNELGEDYLKILQASSSLPFISKPVKYKNRILMDGGVSDSIPIKKSIEDGNTKNVIILTQPKGYRKEPESLAGLCRYRYPKFKGLCRALRKRHLAYNETEEYIEWLQKENKVFVIRPVNKLIVGRIERDQSKLHTVYDQGYEDAKNNYETLNSYLNCQDIESIDK